MIVWLAVAGGCGALARWMVTAWFAGRSRLGTGTAIVNVAGALGLGLVLGLQQAGLVGDAVALVAGVGFLGSLTTFSTWMVETAESAAGHPVRAITRTVPLLGAGMLVAWLAVEAFK